MHDDVEPEGVTGNARLTGAAGAVIFVLLAIEGLTILRVRQLISLHVFIGVLLGPLVLLKVATTAYRAARYYRGDARYVRKGPPPLILRLLGPMVVVLSLAVLGTGLAAIAAGRRHSDLIITAHKAAFVLWFGAMAVHVLGHILETPALAIADWSRRNRAVRGASLRIGVLLATIAIGAAVATVSLGWIGAWRH
jgi:hypothetical protein